MKIYKETINFVVRIQKVVYATRMIKKHIIFMQLVA